MLYDLESSLLSYTCVYINSNLNYVKISKPIDYSNILMARRRLRGFAWRPCCMLGTIKMFCIRMNICVP